MITAKEAEQLSKENEKHSAEYISSEIISAASRGFYFCEIEIHHINIETQTLLIKNGYKIDWIEEFDEYATIRW